MRVDKRRLYGRRGGRKKGFMVPFGDIVLPFAGMLAVCLLLIAAKLFFMNGLSAPSGLASAQPVPDVPFVPDAPLEDYAFAGATASPVAEPQPAARTDGAETAAGGKSGNNAGAVYTVEVTATPVADEPYLEADGPVALTDGAPRADAPKPAQQTKTQPQQKAKPAAKKPAASQQPWRVQVGAYGSRGAAADIVKKLAKRGYTATVFSGPKYHKVWVQAGSTKAAAEKTAARLKSSGYPGSYVVPPAK